MSETPTRLAAVLSDRYRLERELGQGGMATVYLAHDLKHDRQVAVKVLRPELAAVIGAERFLSEIKTTANLQHPHILPLFDSGRTGGRADGQTDDFLYYVMPYIEGESLRDRLNREKQLPIPDAVRIASEIAGALDYAHRHNVVHRDIKPENILLHDGRALVADFGIALAASKSGGSRMTETGMSLGTPTYMSPEQAMGEREITARSDVYALGCVLYEMLIGEPPFNGPTAQAIVAKVMTAEPASLTHQRKSIPPQVEAAVHTALEKLPADRFASAAQFAEALANPGFTAVGTSAAGRSGHGGGAAGVSRRAFVATAALAAVLLVGLLWSLLRPAATPVTTRQRVTLWRQPLWPFLAPGSAIEGTQAAIAPDGSSIVFCDIVGDSARLMRKLRHEAEARPMAGTEGGVSPFFSPDGRWVGFVTLGGRLRKVPVEGGGAVTIATDVNTSYLSAAWLDDGTIVYMATGTELRRVSAEGGTSRAVQRAPRLDRPNEAAISPLPGSRGVLYTWCPGNCAVESAVFVFDFAADSARLLVPDAAGAWYSPTGHLLYTDRAGGLYAAGFDPRRLKLTSGAVPVLEDVAPARFAMSASGSVLYSTNAGTTSSELVWVSRDGRPEPLDSGWKADFQYPALSPDGKALAVSVSAGSTQIWIRRSDGARQKLTDTGSVNWRPAWTPDGKSIVFISNRGSSGGGGEDDNKIYLMPADGSAPARLLLHHTFGLWEAEISRDGQWLVVRSDEAGGKSNLRGRRLQGDTALVPLVVNKGGATFVSLSPDGHWLGYSTDATGRYEIYVSPFPEMTSTHLVSREGGTEPRWAHSGRELFFKSGNQLMAVQITPGPPFVSGAPRPLFSLSGYRGARNRQQYDVAPGDQRFVMIRESSDAAAGSVVYVDNWIAELEAKVGAGR